MRHPPHYTIAIVLGVVAASWWMFAQAPSPDLKATWIAGHFYALGLTDQVYAGNSAYFTMLPDPSWTDWLVARGEDPGAYPFVYPPLWAAVASWLTPWASFEAVKAAANLVNPALMAGMVWLAARTARDSDVSVTLMTLVGSVTLLVSLPGGAALEQNQPQILVGFLVVAAIERARAGAPLTAGAALALAASIKLFPALLVVAWIAGGRWRGVAAFAALGAVLAGLSVWLAGWPLHQAFLDEIDAIRRSIVVTKFTYGIDPILAQTLFREDMEQVRSASGIGWSVLAKPASWVMASSLALIAILTAAALWFRRNASGGEPPDVLAWPVLLIALTFVSPLAWGYHYLPAMAFLPHLLDRFGLRAGLLAIIAAILPLTLMAQQLASQAPATLNLPILLGALTMLGHAALFGLAIRSRRGPRHLHAHPVSL